MKDIAQEAGVSKATVSRVINNNVEVSDITREKVMKLVKKYDYKPDTTQSKLAKNLSHTIGIMLPTSPRSIAAPFFVEFFSGIGNVAANFNYSLALPTIKSVNNETDLYKELVKFDQVDGVILTEPKLNDERINYLKSKNIPFVSLGRTYKDDGVYWVDSDNISGAYKATEHLIKKGHQKIACIAGVTELITSHTRLKGYKNALLDHGFAFNPKLIARGELTKQSGYLAMKQLLSKNKSFTAVFVVDDLMAIGAIKALKEQEIKIPEECAIVGFNGIDLGTYIEPTLTTVQQPIYELGQQTAKMIIKLIEQERVENKHKVLPIKMVLRDSS